MPRAIADPSQMAVKSTNKPAKRSAAAAPYRYSLEDKPTRTGPVLSASGSVLSGLGPTCSSEGPNVRASSATSRPLKKHQSFKTKREQTRANEQTINRNRLRGEQRAYGNADSADGRLCHSPLGSHQARCLGNRQALDRSFRCKHGLFL